MYTNNITLSWTSLSLFLQCRRCFYKMQVLKMKRPATERDFFALNNAVDILWKKEFDHYRKQQLTHPIMVQNKIDAIPFEHELLLCRWRNYKSGGIKFIDLQNGIELSGVIDDLWFNQKTQELIIVDYKATAKHTEFMTYAVKTKWTVANERQMSFYAYLFKKNNFAVHATGYFIYSAVRTNTPFFDNKLDFQSAVLPCWIDDSWIEQTLKDIRSCLDQTKLPEPAKDCEFCEYDIVPGVAYEG